MNRPQTRIFVGQTGKKLFVRTLQELDWGRIWTRDKPNLFPGETWAFDNGAYTAFLKKLPFPKCVFEKRLERAKSVGTPYMAVVPDLVGEGVNSLEFSVKWAKHLKSVKWPWYLALQDGMLIKHVRPYLSLFDGLFLGGTDNFKKQAGFWSRFSKDEGLPFHYGRAGTFKKLEQALHLEVDSLDSSFPLWTTKRFFGFVDHWISLTNPPPSLS